jgi:hypothetical protein
VLASNTDEDLLMDIQPTARGESRLQKNKNQHNDSKEATNLPSDNETLENNNTMEIANAPLQGRPTMDTEIREGQSEQNTGKGNPYLLGGQTM